MAVDKTFWTFVGVDMLFLGSGAMMMVFALVIQASATKELSVKTVSRDLLLQECPLRGKHLSMLAGPLHF
jgi:hypothetical protein